MLKLNGAVTYDVVNFSTHLLCNIALTSENEERPREHAGGGFMAGQKHYAELIDQLFTVKLFRGLRILRLHDGGGNVIEIRAVCGQMRIEQFAQTLANHVARGLNIGPLFNRRPGGLEDKSFQLDLRHAALEHHKSIEHFTRCF